MAVERPLTIVSSDGHVGARMADYRPYLDPEHRAEFDDFLPRWEAEGVRSIDRRSLETRIDPEFVDEWSERFLDNGRLDGFESDPDTRMSEMESEGVAAEVLFPEFGIPFQLYSGIAAHLLGRLLERDELKRAGMLAYNRWLADFVATAPERFAGMALVSWQQDVPQILREIRAAKDAGLRGVILPEFDPEEPLYHPRFEDVWSLLEDLELVVNSHGGLSATTNKVVFCAAVPHPALAGRIYYHEHAGHIRNILPHLIWGGVLERHPSITAVFTEMASSWVIDMLVDMDYAYDGSYKSASLHDALPMRPSEYFQRQCFMGASLFSRAEIGARRTFGIDKLMLGMDLPHHEGTMLRTSPAYLRATLGAEHVPEDEARRMLGANAAEVFGFDLESLAPVAARIGLRPSDVLTPPERDLFPRGDVRRPLV